MTCSDVYEWLDGLHGSYIPCSNLNSCSERLMPRMSSPTGAFMTTGTQARELASEDVAIRGATNSLRGVVIY